MVRLVAALVVFVVAARLPSVAAAPSLRRVGGSGNGSLGRVWLLRTGRVERAGAIGS